MVLVDRVIRVTERQIESEKGRLKPGKECVDQFKATQKEKSNEVGIAERGAPELGRQGCCRIRGYSRQDVCRMIKTFDTR